MKQRVMIAMALLCEPRLLIADEPTTALDVTVQAQILHLMRELQRRSAAPPLLVITHDMGVIAEMCDDVAVMYAGRVVERQAGDRACSSSAATSRTRGACSTAHPASGVAHKAELPTIEGTVPSLSNAARRAAALPTVAGTSPDARMPTIAASAASAVDPRLLSDGVGDGVVACHFPFDRHVP